MKKIKPLSILILPHLEKGKGEGEDGDRGSRGVNPEVKKRVTPHY